MNRKNLTAAVLAGLAGVAGMAGAANAGFSPDSAVNLNPDGLGQVLIYPFYTSNDGNTTLITVVNTTDQAKAVKVRFLEGYNSREVLDFNLYLSHHDVWVAAITDDGGTPTLLVPDTSCTVPYIYGDFDGEQEFLPYAFTGDFDDGGPTDISRAAEGYLEMIEMGTMTDNDAVKEDEFEGDLDQFGAKIGEHDARMGSATASTHVIKTDDDDEDYVEPADCQLLVENWTEYRGAEVAARPHFLSGWWLDEAVENCGESDVADVDPDDVGVDDCGLHDGLLLGLSSTTTNSGGLFGGAAIINVADGTMVSYDARAVQGYDTTADGLHYYPGTIHPSLNDGNVDDAIVFLGKGQFTALNYSRGVDAISAVFMHDEIANTFVIQEDIAAATEWVVTFPTKAWYVDSSINDTIVRYYTPDPDDAGCNGWDPGEPNPYRVPVYSGGSNPDEAGSWWPDDDPPDAGNTNPATGEDWSTCTPIIGVDDDSVAPFTTVFDGEACERATIASWDREESPTVQGGSIQPPVVSPAPPGTAPPGEELFELCYEVNLLRFGEGSVFGGETVTDGGLTLEVGETADNGWARITLASDDGVSSCVACGSKADGYPELHRDVRGLHGLPVTGFAAETYTNGNVANGVLANYGGLFNHKGSVRCDYPDFDGACSEDFLPE